MQKIRSKCFSVTLVATAAAAVSIVSSAQAPQEKGKGKGGPPAAQPQKIEMIKPDFYVVTGAGGNSSVRVTKQGLIVVDTKNLGDQFYNDLMAQIQTVSKEPVKYVIVTHHHQDHSGNIGKFVSNGAEVIANEGLKKNLETYNPAQGKPAPPNVTYATDKTIKLGGVKVEIHHFGNAHTGGDSIVYFPGDKVVATGDVVVGIVPNVDYPFGGSAVEWLTVLDKIAKLNFDTLVPGHSGQGKTTLTKAEFMDYKKKWETLVSRAEEQVAKGTPKEMLLASIKTDDIGWNINNQQWGNPQRLDAFYADLQKANAAKKK